MGNFLKDKYSKFIYDEARKEDYDKAKKREDNRNGIGAENFKWISGKVNEEKPMFK